MFQLNGSIEVFNVEFAVSFCYNAIEEIVGVPFVLKFFAVSQLWFHLEMLSGAVKV